MFPRPGQLTLIALLLGPVLSSCGKSVTDSDPSLHSSPDKSAQDRRSADLDELLYSLGSDAPKTRDTAAAQLVKRWQEWTPQELAKIEESGRHQDPEVRERASLALARIRKRRELGEVLVQTLPDVDRTLLTEDDKPLLQQLELATDLWKRGKLADPTFELLVKTIRSRTWPATADAVINLIREERVVPLAPLLVSFLKADSSDIRIRAVVTVERLGMKDLLQELLVCLRDDTKEVRAAAAKALGELGLKEAAPKIVPLLEDDQESVRRSAARSLALIGTDDSARQTVRLLKSDKPAVRSFAVESLSAVDRFAPDAAALLKDSDGGVRASALVALRGMRRKDYADAALPLLEDPSLEVRGEALRTIGTLGSTHHLSALRKMLKHDEPQLRVQALKAMGQLTGDEGGDDVMAMLGDADEEVRAAACWFLSRVGSLRFQKRFLQLLEEPSSRVRDAALELVVAAKPKEIIDEVSALLEDKNPHVRSTAIQLVGRLDLRVLSGKLLSLLEDENKSVKLLAALHLRYLLVPERASDKVLNLCRSDDSATTALAALLVGEWRLPGGTSMLTQLLRHENVEVRLAATRALGKVGSSEHLDSLAKLLNDPDQFVPAEAALSIGRLASELKGKDLTPNVVKALREVVEGKSRTLRVGASIALIELGQENKEAQLRLLRELLLTPSLESAFATPLSDVLGKVYMRDSFTQLETRIPLRESIENLDDLMKILSRHNLRLRPPTGLAMHRRVEGGVSLSIRDLLRRAFGEFVTYVCDGGEVRILSDDEALEFWRQWLHR